MIVLAIIFWLLGITDVFITQEALRMGAREVNPFISFVVKEPILHFIAVGTVNLIIIIALLSCNIVYVWLVFVIMIAMQMLVIHHNWREINGKH